MPPVTRAALRSNTSKLDDCNNNNPTANAASVISETSTARPVLGEVAGNSEPSTAANDVTAREVSTKKSTAKGSATKKGKGNKQATQKERPIGEIENNAAAVPEEEENEPQPEEQVDGFPEAVLSEGRQKGAVSIGDILIDYLYVLTNFLVIHKV